MKPEAIYCALCSIDPALEPWQKCRHEWECVAEIAYGAMYQFKCTECRHDGWGGDEDELPTFGDGKPRYNSVDEPLALCERLDIKVEIESRASWDANDGTMAPRYSVWIWVGGKMGTQVHNHSLVLALQEAILRAMGKWTEVEV
jgi:hypothetical protein